MTNLNALDTIGDAIETFETSWSPDACNVILQTLGGYGLQDDAEAISELVRIDIERRYYNGLTCSISDYLHTFPALAMDHERTAEIAFEDFRVRSRLGHPLRRERYQAVPGIEDLDWYRELRVDSTPSPVAPKGSLPIAELDVAKLLLKIGFQLVRMLGEGAFSRVYLARQSDLAEREVVLKLVRQSQVEPQIMATLQHTNIVPIYSYHWVDSVCVICMPYAGTVTLRSYMAAIHETNVRDGLSIVKTICERTEHSQTQPGKPANSVTAVELQPLQRLAELDREQLAIFIFTRLASALVHSHDRSVMHGDIKPANVLLRDDGEPALLDFNLSRHSGVTQVTTVGGTFPYMSPETIRTLLDNETIIDARSDIYSLGVVMYEFMTGRLPYPRPKDSNDAALQDALTACERSPNWQVTDRVSPSLRSIVARCLAYSLQARYATAAQLSEDLERHRDSLPLRHAPESGRQRLSKFGRRHPSWSSGAGVFVVLSAILLPVVLLGWNASTTARQLESTMRFAKFEADSNQALIQTMADPQRFQKEGVDALIAPLNQLSLLNSNVDHTAPDAVTSWLESGDLPIDVLEHRRKIIFRHATQAGIAEWQRLVAARTPKHAEEPDSRKSDSTQLSLQRLGALIEIAKACRGQKSSRALSFLESDLAELNGNQAKANALQTMADGMVPSDDDEVYLEAVRLMAERKWRSASQLLTSLADRESIPSALRWTYLARTLFQIGEFENAKLSLTQSLEHVATSAQLWLLRGTCFVRLRDYESAQNDFRNAIRLSPNQPGGYLKLAECLMLLDRPEDAYEQLTTSLQFAPNDVLTLLMRSRVASKLGRVDAAQEDQMAAYEAKQPSAAELLYRSEQRLATDMSGALRDIEMAISIAPSAPRLLHHLAKTQTRLGMTSEAIETLSRIQTMSPDDDKATIDRAVLLARVKRSEEAEQEMIKVVKPSSPAPVLYQAACVCALLPDQGAHIRALGYLSTAIQRGYGAGQLASDHDLDALHDLPGYRAILKTIQLARASDAASPIPDNSPPSELDYE